MVGVAQMTVTIIATGLDKFAKFAEELPDLYAEAAYLAVNEASRDTVPMLKSNMRSQINFPSGYLNKDRLGVRKNATRTTLQAVISGRDRATSLSRFVKGSQATKGGRRVGPVNVEVKTGTQTELTRAFLVNLRNGNTGLAIRLPKGQTPDAAYRPTELTRKGGQGQSVWLLYGPSVDQIMRGVSGEVQDDVMSMLDRNFSRQISRLVRRG